MNKQILFSVTKKDLIIEPYKGSGKGGQHRNKTMSCCRIKHVDSGATAQCCDERDFHKNRKVAFRRLVNNPKFQTWRKIKTAELMNGEKKLEKIIENAMKPQNIKMEIKENGRWIEVPKEDIESI